MEAKTFHLKKIYRGFTLVELIVVITILVILGTIAFLNLGGFQSNARDGRRVSDMSNISKALDIAIVTQGNAPIPSNPTSYTGGLVTLQVGTITSTTVPRMNGDFSDPLTKVPYNYSVLANGSYYQIGIDFENPLSYHSGFYRVNTSIPGIETVYADNSAIKYSKLSGSYKFDPSLPSLFILSGSYNSASGGIFSPDVCFVMEGISTNSFTSSSGTCLPKNKMSLNTLDTSLVGYWDMETLCIAGICGVGNDGYIKNLASNDTAILSGTTLRNHNNAVYSTKTATGNAILGTTSAYITDFDSALQTSDNIKGIEKNMTIEMLVKPNFTTNFDGQWGHTWNRNFFYDYWSSTIRFALLNESIGLAGYKGALDYETLAKGFNFEKNKVVHLAVAQTITLSGETKVSQLKLYVNGTLYNSMHGGSPISSTVNYSQTGSILHIGSAYNNPEDCGGIKTNFSMVTAGCTTNGTFDDVKLYNRALSDDEIKQHAKIAGF